MESTLEKLERETWEVLCVSGDKLLPFLDPACKMLFPGGMIISAKSEPSLASVMTSTSFDPWSSYKLYDLEVTLLDKSNTAGLVTYRAEAIRKSKEYKALISSVWTMQENGSWKLRLHQQTPF